MRSMARNARGKFFCFVKGGWRRCGTRRLFIWARGTRESMWVESTFNCRSLVKDKLGVSWMLVAGNANKLALFALERAGKSIGMFIFVGYLISL